MEDTYARPTPIIETYSGKLRGYNYDGVNVFKNIKYATAERWALPVPYQWEGIRECNEYGYIPIQPNNDLPEDDFIGPHEFRPSSEDCLSLNIWTPDLDREAKLPVIVTVYGGSFETGSAIDFKAYEGTNLSRDGNLVYVTLNMRINIFGFFNLACFGSEYENTGNLGFEDVLCALKWVRNNIVLFGGDPDNITLFGMQGGGLRIKYIMQCSAFKGLFHKVFNLSGISDHGAPPAAVKYYELAKAALRKGGFPDDDITPLRDMPAYELQKLIDRTKKEENIRLRSRCQLNGWCYGRTEDSGVNPDMKDITVVMGNVFTEQGYPVKERHDGRLSHDEFEKQALERFQNDYEAVRTEYAACFPDCDIRDVLYYADDQRGALLEYADMLSANGMTVYTYLFNEEFPVYGGMPAVHTCDVSYIMRNTYMVPALHIPDHTVQLEDLYSSMLINLAHNGTPVSELTEDWNPYLKEKPETVYLNRNVRYLHNEDRRLLQLLKKHPQKRGMK